MEYFSVAIFIDPDYGLSVKSGAFPLAKKKATNPVTARDDEGYGASS